jgi:hypothetical protein
MEKVEIVTRHFRDIHGAEPAPGQVDWWWFALPQRERFAFYGPYRACLERAKQLARQRYRQMRTPAPQLFVLPRMEKRK